MTDDRRTGPLLTATLADQAAAAWRIRDRARLIARQRPGHPSPLSVAEQAAALALAAQWFTREPPATQRHAEPLTRARLRALTTELETLE